MQSFLAKLLIVQIFGALSLFAQVRLEIFRGSEILPFVPELANISLIVNQNYPCFYRACEGPECYLRQYSQSKAAILCIAYDDCQIVGFTIGAPLSACVLFFPGFFFPDRFAIDRLFYIGEVSLLPEYRKGTIGCEMLCLVETTIRRESIYFGICLVSLDDRCRDRPVGFLSSTYFWENMGYSRLSYSSQRLIHWVKSLQGRGLPNEMWQTQFAIPDESGMGDFY